MTKADRYPDQAEADMSRLQAEARVADDAQTEAARRVEELERRLDAANDPEIVERLLSEHQKAEVVLQDAKTDFDSVMDQIGQATTFWYE